MASSRLEAHGRIWIIFHSSLYTCAVAFLLLLTQSADDDLCHRRRKVYRPVVEPNQVSQPKPWAMDCVHDDKHVRHDDGVRHSYLSNCAPTVPSGREVGMASTSCRHAHSICSLHLHFCSPLVTRDTTLDAPSWKFGSRCRFDQYYRTCLALFRPLATEKRA